MKKMKKEMVTFIVANVAGLCAFFLVPFIDFLKNYGVGVLQFAFPLLFVPIIGLVLGFLYKKPFQLLFPVVMGVLSVIYTLVVFDCIEIAYTAYYILAPLVFMLLAMGIKFIVSKLVALIRKKAPAKD